MTREHGDDLANTTASAQDATAPGIGGAPGGRRDVRQAQSGQLTAYLEAQGEPAADTSVEDAVFDSFASAAGQLQTLGIEGQELDGDNVSIELSIHFPELLGGTAAATIRSAADLRSLFSELNNAHASNNAQGIGQALQMRSHRDLGDSSQLAEDWLATSIILNFAEDHLAGLDDSSPTAFAASASSSLVQLDRDLTQLRGVYQRVDAELADVLQIDFPDGVVRFMTLGEARAHCQTLLSDVELGPLQELITLKNDADSLQTAQTDANLEQPLTSWIAGILGGADAVDIDLFTAADDAVLQASQLVGNRDGDLEDLLRRLGMVEPTMRAAGGAVDLLYGCVAQWQEQLIVGANRGIDLVRDIAIAACTGMAGARIVGALAANGWAVGSARLAVSVGSALTSSFSTEAFDAIVRGERFNPGDVLAGAATSVAVGQVAGQLMGPVVEHLNLGTLTARLGEEVVKTAIGDALVLLQGREVTLGEFALHVGQNLTLAAAINPDAHLPGSTPSTGAGPNGD